MIRAVIADDEVHARERLREMLGRFALFEIVGEARDGSEALSQIVALRPDAAFLDINMPGVSVFSSISSLQDPPLIVFQTAHAEHAAAAYDINAVDYLLKPVRFERLEKAVGKLREALAARGAASVPLRTEEPVEPTGQLTVSVAGKSRVLAPEEIIRISFENGFCYLYVGSERLMSDKYLAHYEDKLKGRRFFRASRTDLVNLDCLSAIHRELPGMYVLEMKNGMKVELSRRQARALRALVDF